MNKVYYLEVEYRWSTHRGSAKQNHYRKDYAISQYNTLEEVNKDNTNYAFAVQRFGLKGKKFTDFQVTKIISFKEVPTPK